MIESIQDVIIWKREGAGVEEGNANRKIQIYMEVVKRFHLISFMPSLRFSPNVPCVFKSIFFPVREFLLKSW